MAAAPVLDKGFRDDRNSHLHYRAQRKTKAIKALEAKRHFVLGWDIFLDKVEMLCNHALVSQLEYCKFEIDVWVVWATHH